VIGIGRCTDTILSPDNLFLHDNVNLPNDNNGPLRPLQSTQLTHHGIPIIENSLEGDFENLNARHKFHSLCRFTALPPPLATPNGFPIYLSITLSSVLRKFTHWEKSGLLKLASYHGVTVASTSASQVGVE
jgi:hypothetical protein